MFVVLVTASSAVVLSLLPHQWQYVAPLAAIWVVAIVGLCVLFGARATVSVVAAVVSAGAAVGLPYAWIIRDYVEVSGTITCASHAGVKGAWVRGADGETGWARWSPVDVEYRAVYKYTLHARTRFRLGIGCSGTTKNWRVDIVTPFVSPGRHDWICHDRGRSGTVCTGCILARGSKEQA